MATPDGSLRAAVSHASIAMRPVRRWNRSTKVTIFALPASIGTPSQQCGSRSRARMIVRGRSGSRSRLLDAHSRPQSASWVSTVAGSHTNRPGGLTPKRIDRRTRSGCSWAYSKATRVP
jgi:hypothetical protein